jgi:hypothetical protein
MVFDAQVRAMGELRADNERLRAELASIESGKSRRRAWHFGVAAAWVSVLGATVFFAHGYARASFDAQSRKAHGEACWDALRARREDLERIVVQFDGFVEVEALSHAVDECRAWRGACTDFVWEPEETWPEHCICR